MRISKLLAVFIFALSCAVGARAQQTIPKGSWVLSAPQDSSLGVMGDYASSESCKQAWMTYNAIAKNTYNQALLMAKQNYRAPYDAAMAAPPGQARVVMAAASAQDDFLMQQLQNATEVYQAVQAASCAQQ